VTEKGDFEPSTLERVRCISGLAGAAEMVCNVLSTGPQHWNWHERYYPGDDVVDMVGIHAFNDPRSQGAWVPFEELVDGDAADYMFTDLLERHPTKALIFGELATDEHSHQWNAKARWIANAFARVRACPAIHAVVWFDMRKERDWRIASSSRSLRAFRRAVANEPPLKPQAASDSREP
jgi:hypothetical protein